MKRLTIKAVCGTMLFSSVALAGTPLQLKEDAKTDLPKLQKYSTSSPNLIMQGLSIEALKRREVERSIFYYKQEIGKKYTILMSELRQHGLLDNTSPIVFSRSTGGFFLWGKCKNGENTYELLQQSLQYGVSFIPGNIYGKNGDYNDCLRLCFSHIQKNDIPEAIARFSSCIKNIF